MLLKQIDDMFDDCIPQKLSHIVNQVKENLKKKPTKNNKQTPDIYVSVSGLNKFIVILHNNVQICYAPCAKYCYLLVIGFVSPSMRIINTHFM